MKLTKKLLPALGMLALSACMLVTSTFAWFSMNENVVAKDMTITAKGNQVYLQIINANGSNDGNPGNDTAFVDGKAQTWSNANNTSAELLPVNVKADKTNWNEYNGGNTFVWATATGTTPSNGDVSGAYSEATGTNYYLKNTFKIRLDPTAGAANASGPLTVESVTFTADYDSNDLGASVCVLVVCGSNSQLWTQDTTAGTFASHSNSDEYLDATTVGSDDVFNNTTGVTVDVYVFFNGDHDNCTLEKLAAANTAGTNSYPIEVTFTVA